MTALAPAKPTIIKPIKPGSPNFAPILADIVQADAIFNDSLTGQRSPVASLIQHLKHYRGKRLRPALLLLTAKACGGVRTAHHTLAAAVEMIHTATLVHDDVLDEAETRRHIPTFNAEWGNKVSILLGDMLFTQAFHLTSRIDARACQLIGAATNAVCSGELKQICNRGNLELTEADYYAIIDGKTAALTEVCTRLGAEYAGATPVVADKLAAFGKALGRAFQIADDLLDLTSDETQAGKTLGTDLDQGKLTLPLIHALNSTSKAEADELKGWLRSNEPGRRKRIADYLIGSGSLVYAKKAADDQVRIARAALQIVPNSESRALLDQLAEWSVRREK